jgi:transcriptional regulator with XRE-family HTH domain
MTRRGPGRSLAAVMGARIRAYRDEHGWTQDRLGRAVNATGDFIGKCERGERVPGPKVCEKLDELLGAGDYFRQHAPCARQALAPDWLLRFFDAEAEATCIRTFETQVVTGLLQTEDYARAVITAGAAPNVDELVSTRMDRQVILDRKEPPRLWTVFEEPVIHRRVDPVIAKAQFAHLLEMSNRLNVVLQILPNRVGLHAGLDGSFLLLTLADGREVAYTEAPGGGQVIEDPVKVARMTVWYDLIRAESLSASDSVHLIKRAMEQL